MSKIPPRRYFVKNFYRASQILRGIGHKRKLFLNILYHLSSLSRAYNFFEATSFEISLFSVKLTTNCFNRPFSTSN